MHRILITGLGSNIGQGIFKSLRLAEIPCEIVGTDVYRWSAGFAWCKANYQVPYANDARYIPSFIEILKKHQIQLVLVGSESEAAALSQNQAKVEKESGAKLLVADWKFVSRCGDKWGVVELFQEAKLDHPDSIIDMSKRADFIGKHGFPVLIKPRRGWSARDVHRIEDKASLDFFATHIQDPILQEYLDGEEFTCALVFDREGNYADHVVMRREILHGTTFRAEIIANPAIDRYLESFARSIRYQGPMNVQLRLCKRGPIAFEINPRFSGTTGMRCLAGFNDAAALVRHYLEGKPISKASPQKARILRYWEEVLVEEGDSRFPRESS